jgi:hypothetical protein
MLAQIALTCTSARIDSAVLSNNTDQPSSAVVASEDRISALPTWVYPPLITVLPGEQVAVTFILPSAGM